MKIDFKNKTTRNILIALIGSLIVIAVVAKKQGWIGKTEIVKVSIEKVSHRSIIESITASGKIQPETEIMIAPDASGEIKGLFVKEGDSVVEGQLLLKINPDIYLSTLDKVNANLNSTKANLANSKARLSQSESQLIKAKADYNRSKSLHEKDVISDADFEAAQSQYDIAKAEVEAAKENVLAAKFAVSNAEAGLKEANDNLTKTAVFSPITGTVSKLSKEVGERVSGASQFSPGTEVMRIANLNNMEAQVDVSENDIVKVHLYDTALVEVDAYLGRKFKGLVTQIANSSNNTTAATDQVTNFTVKIRLLPSSYKDLLDPKNHNLSPFRPGMSASVEILTTYRTKVISVPIQAVTTRDDTSSYTTETSNAKFEKNIKKDTISTLSNKAAAEYVFVYKDGKVMLRKVKIGIQDTDYYEILEGLKEGEEVVIAPYQAISKKLKNNQPVEKTDKDKLFDKKEE
jgi:HlyD family secretion protein